MYNSVYYNGLPVKIQNRVSYFAKQKYPTLLLNIGIVERSNSDVYNWKIDSFVMEIGTANKNML